MCGTGYWSLYWREHEQPRPSLCSKSTNSAREFADAIHRSYNAIEDDASSGSEPREPEYHVCICQCQCRPLQPRPLVLIPATPLAHSRPLQ